MKEQLAAICKAMGFVLVETGAGLNAANEVSASTFNPMKNHADCAVMCAQLRIDTEYWDEAVECRANFYVRYESFKDHETPLKAWMAASCAVAAEIGRAM